jgi:hypothetical protein
LLFIADKDVYNLTTAEFLEQSAKSKRAHRTLGAIFRLHKLNPTLVIEDELDQYLLKRNVFVHKFWKAYLPNKKGETTKKAIEFCYDFGKHSDRLSSFFKGFLYFLALHHVNDRSQLEPEISQWADDFEYFTTSLKKNKLVENK